MFKNQRHNEILEILKNEGFASVGDLASRLFASQPTIRRDLDYLEKQGYVRRSHGGAISSDMKTGVPIIFRNNTRTNEKARICRLAATLISPESLIFTDASTTASHLAQHIAPDSDVTVVTSGYAICRTLAENNIRTYSVGGRLLRNSMAFVGGGAVEAVKRFNADIFFFSSSSLDDDGTISDYSEEEITLRRVMYKHAKTSVLLCDSAKFGRRSAHRFLQLCDIDITVTDAPLPDSILHTHNIKLATFSGGAYMYVRI